ncbi:hypothetical protein [Hydrogenophaga sp.]|uniref:hypothetical protein n=1 Tax=Hydrogenophaga sp. TaxID=1904254 RepID=UPI0027223401|nr:hypothetical protein [Hydrogenophaga sp.]MDO8904244.1 hypothetical protein [Hydrogenophaga sp.]
MSRPPVPPPHKPSDLPSKQPPSPANMVSRTPRAPGSKPAGSDEEHLQLPHERDQNTQMTDGKPSRVMVQAAKDIENGLVDTDMRATPGLDAGQRAQDVPGPGGRPGKQGDPSGPSDAPVLKRNRSAEPSGQGRKARR